jgi:hypothetical protein
MIWVQGSGDLSREELRTASKFLIEKLNLYKPKIVCFNGMGIFEACTGGKKVHALAPQEQKILT